MAKAAKGVKTKKRDYRKKQRSTSIYFLLWATFTALSLLIVLLFGVIQGFMMARTYKSAAARELKDKGRQLETLILQDPPPEYKGNKSLYLRMLSAEFDVNIFILDGSGEVLYPHLPKLEGESESAFDFSEEIVVLKEELAARGGTTAVYEGDGVYVYGSKIEQYGVEAYLYIGKSLDLMLTTSRAMNGRTTIVAVFIFVLSFAVSSAVSAWLTRPITEMTAKANRLARGDFAVDFHGADYGQEMVALAETLNYARDELSKTDRMQRELIANVSHDFKTPLTMIKAYASMIIEISGENKEKRNKHAQVIVDEADRLASLVGDVLELSKMRSGIDEVKWATFDMSAYLHEILSRFEYLKDTGGYTFVVDVEDGLWTRGDEIKLGQVLYNLIGNAVNYTGEDKTVYVSLKKTVDGVFRFAVRDTGVGIKQEEIATIWERYYRSSETHKRPVKGTGLGLSIVKTVLERHAFVFGVESEVGKGSVFFVDFPLEEESKG